MIAPGVSVFSLFAFNLIGVFYSQFLPGNITGDLVKGYYLARTEADKGPVFSSVVVDRFIAIVMNGLLGLIALFANQVILSALKIDAMLPMVTLIIVTVGLVSGFFMLSHLGSWENRLPAVVASFVHSIRQYANHPFALSKAVVVNFLYFLIWSLAFWCLMQAIGLTQLSYITALLILAAVGFVQVVPISINGRGVRESALILLLGFYGVSSERALLFSLLIAAVNILLAFIGGIIVLADYRHVRGQTWAP